MTKCNLKAAAIKKNTHGELMDLSFAFPAGGRINHCRVLNSSALNRLFHTFVENLVFIHEEHFHFSEGNTRSYCPLADSRLSKSGLYRLNGAVSVDRCLAASFHPYFSGNGLFLMQADSSSLSLGLLSMLPRLYYCKTHLRFRPVLLPGMSS